MSDQQIFTQEAPALIGIGAQSIVDRAKQLGLTWTLRPATVTVSGMITDTQVTYDGDTVPISCFNISGSRLFVGDRVMGMQVPPSGNFIIGTLFITARTAANYNAPGVVGSTSSATFVSMPGTPTAPFTKNGNSLQSALSCCVELSMFASVQGTAEVAVNINGIDNRVFISVAPGTQVIYFSAGTVFVNGLTAGPFTAGVTWRISGGVGTYNQNTNCYVSLTINEVPL